MLLRLIFFLLVFYFFLSIVRSYLRRRRFDVRKLSPDQLGEDMVQDPQCLTYIPKSEAVISAGRYFCSEECARGYLSR